MAHPVNSLNTLRMVQGQTKVISVKVKTAAGRVAVLTGASMFFTLRKNANGAALITKTTSDGIVISDAGAGEAIITLDITDTDLSPGEYRYDVWVEYPGTPVVRQPVVKYAQLYVTSAITDFSTP